MKKNLFTLALACLASASLIYAQDTIPKLTIDSTLTVGDSAIFSKSLRVEGETFLKENTTASRDLIVDGNAFFNAGIFYPNAPVLSGAMKDRDILVFDPETGAIEKSGIGEMQAALYSFTCNTVNGVVETPTWSNAPNKIVVGCPEVRVGIGTTDPSHSLHVTGNGLFQNSLEASSAGIGGLPSTFSRFKVTNGSSAAAIEANNTGNALQFNKLLFLQFDNPSTEIIKVVNTQTGHVPFFLEANGRMTIHNGTQKTFQLDPSGELHTRKIYVDVYQWPDYVFEPSYQLRPLDDVKAFVASNHHLPNIPSAAQVEAEGVDLATMDKALTKTVEELYLYIIQLEERIKELEEKK